MSSGRWTGKKSHDVNSFCLWESPGKKNRAVWNAVPRAGIRRDDFLLLLGTARPALRIPFSLRLVARLDRGKIKLSGHQAPIPIGTYFARSVISSSDHAMQCSARCVPRSALLYSLRYFSRNDIVNPRCAARARARHVTEVCHVLLKYRISRVSLSGAPCVARKSNATISRGKSRRRRKSIAE